MGLDWLIALGICTLYGWIMHRRGITKGSNRTAIFIVNALIDDGKMTAPQIEESIKKAYAKIMSNVGDS